MTDPNAPLLPPPRRAASERPSVSAAPTTASHGPEPEERRGLPLWPVPIALLAIAAVVLSLKPPRFARPLLESGRAAARIEPYAARLLFDPTRPAAVAPPKVCGKLVTIDAGSRHVDESFHALDPAIRADDASQIGTVARVSCREVSLGTFAGTTSANTFAIRCRVDLADYRTRAWLGALSIDSEDLPAPMRRTGEVHGGRPDRAIARWLSSLPRSCG